MEWTTILGSGAVSGVLSGGISLAGMVLSYRLGRQSHKLELEKWKAEKAKEEHAARKVRAERLLPHVREAYLILAKTPLKVTNEELEQLRAAGDEILLSGYSDIVLRMRLISSTKTTSESDPLYERYWAEWRFMYAMLVEFHRELESML